MKKPRSIENRWDILYAKYPEVYDEFAAVAKDPDSYQLVVDKFDLSGKVIADIGSGSGISSFKLAAFAHRVIGVELEPAMLKVAQEKAEEQGINNVEFIEGDARAIPLADSAVDCVTAFTLAIVPKEGYRNFVYEAQRVTKPDGLIIMLNLTPGWYGGELHDIIGDKSTGDITLNEILVDESGFEYFDVELNQEYGSLDKIVRTYGFIFGQKTIDYLQKNKKTNIKWRFRVHYLKVAK